MAGTFTYPGVYIVEVPSGVRTITGVSTSITGFMGRTSRGRTDRPVTVTSYGDFERYFGGLSNDSTVSFAVRDFFTNGGGVAVIARIQSSAATASTLSLPDEAAAGTFDLQAANPGVWGDGLVAFVDHNTAEGAATDFNLTIVLPGGPTEVFRNVSVLSTSSRFVTKVLEQSSDLVRVSATPTDRPDETDAAGEAFTGGVDSDPLTLTDFVDTGFADGRRGLFMFDHVDLINLLCIPPDTPDGDVDTSLVTSAAAYCEGRRAFLVLDGPADWDDVTTPETEMADPTANLGTNSRNSAVYFPRLRQGNPLRDSTVETFPTCGSVAGIMARTDATRGVWKAPAGQEAVLNGVPELVFELNDGDIGRLNPLGVNCLRPMTGIGRVVYGARTLQGADRLASEWKYVPVRRLALFIEESLYRGTQWAVFEPNDEPLWAQLRLNIGAFMNNLFRQGAFQGATPREAYFVKVDRETTTQNDINLGIVNIQIGFAPLKPAEFVVISIQQMAGQVEV